MACYMHTSQCHSNQRNGDDNTNNKMVSMMWQGMINDCMDNKDITIKIPPNLDGIISHRFLHYPLYLLK